MTDSLPPSERISGRYELRALIGTGAMGTVWSAWDTVLAREVAVKRVRHEGGERPESAANLLREASLLASLQHPNVVTVHDAGVEGDEAHLVMELVQGKTLDQAWTPANPPDLAAFADAAEQLLEGLAAAHGLGLIHRDFKPGNIMVTRQPSGRRLFKILDFGLARASCGMRPQTLEDGRVIRGSAPFIAPEQLKGEGVDGRVDLYAAGCVFYWMLTGRPAFDGGTLMEVVTAHLQHRLMDIRVLAPSLPPLLADWVMSLMNPQPADRYSGAAEALHALRHVLTPVTGATQGLPAAGIVLDPDPAANSVASPAPSRPRAGPALITVAALVVAGGIFAALRKPARDMVAPPPPTTPAAEPAADAAPSAPAAKILDPLDPTAFAGLMGETVTVEGVVRRIGESKSGDVLYVNFAENYRATVSLVFFVDPSRRSEFKAELEGWINRRIRASGKLEDYKGSLQVRPRDAAGIAVVGQPEPNEDGASDR